MRVYLPTTVGGLRSLVDSGGLAVTAGFAVTPALREWYVEGDDEELEYAATTAAAKASLRLLASDAGQPPRRVVLAADVTAARPTGSVGSEDRAAVAVDGWLALSQVESALVDDPAAAEDVRAAVSALASADAGDDDAAFTVDTVEDHELGWYAAQEIAALVELET